jgi:hypothetical protein
MSAFITRPPGHSRHEVRLRSQNALARKDARRVERAERRIARAELGISGAEVDWSAAVAATVDTPVSGVAKTLSRGPSGAVS